jgi:hypothetical protein
MYCDLDNHEPSRGAGSAIALDEGLKVAETLSCRSIRFATASRPATKLQEAAPVHCRAAGDPSNCILQCDKAFETKQLSSRQRRE